MESESQRKELEETLIAILKDADLEEATEHKVRTMASEKLGVDLSDLNHKWLVRRVVESYLLSLEEDEVDKSEEQTKVVVREQEKKRDVDAKEASDNGGRLICKLSEKRGVAVHDFRGKTLVSIRDYYQNEGKLLPSARGISLSTEQWSAFRKGIPDIEAAITNMESQIRIKADMPNSVTAIAQGLPPMETKQIEADISNSVSVSASHGLIPMGAKQNEADICKSVHASAPQGLVRIQTPRLDGKNYYCWVHQMEFFLKQLKIAYVLIEPCPNTALNPEASFEETARSKAEVQKWVDDDYICRHSILNSLSDRLFDRYSKKTKSAKGLWEELKLAYDEDFGTKRSEVNKYIQFQMVEGISIVEQVQELHKIADSIIASGMWIDENFHVSVIISKLPPSWKEYRLKLMQEEFLPLNMLIYRLRVEEESRSCLDKEEPFMKAHTGGSRAENKLGPKKRDLKRPGMYWEPEKDNKTIICYNCGKKGHISRNCHHRKVDFRE